MSSNSGTNTATSGSLYSNFNSRSNSGENSNSSAANHRVQPTSLTEARLRRTLKVWDFLS